MTTKELCDMVKLQLGAPAVNVELSDDEIESSSKLAIITCKDYLKEESAVTITLPPSDDPQAMSSSHYINLDDYPDIEQVTSVLRGDNHTFPFMYDEFNIVNYARRGINTKYLSALRRRSEAEYILNRDYRIVGRKLYIDKYFGIVTLIYRKKVQVIEDISDNYMQSWILRYTTAHCKEILGRRRGKFKVNSNPFESDASDLLSESKSDKEKLLEELSNHSLPAAMRD